MQNVQKFNLEILNHGYYSDYNMDIDASTHNVFAAAVGQFFMSMISDTISYLPRDRQQTSGITTQSIGDLFFNPSPLYFKGRLDAIMRYAMREPAVQFGPQMANSLRNRLFARKNDAGIDMAAMIVQVGRYGRCMFGMCRWDVITASLRTRCGANSAACRGQPVGTICAHSPPTTRPRRNSSTNFNAYTRVLPRHS
jgi:hypothetical protein